MVPNHHRHPVHPSRDSYSTPAKLNSSYHNAIAGDDEPSPSHFSFSSRAAVPTPDMNVTLQPGNRTIDNTLTPSKLPLSPLPTNLPPPPQFGNEAMTSTPNAGNARGPLVPPPYSEAISRSSLASSFNSSNNSNNNNSRDFHSVNTLPGNNPGNRLSVAHHQPMIFHDGDESANEGSDKSSPPSPTTHTLVLTAEDGGKEEATSSTYSFYESQYKGAPAPTRQPPSDTVKVTFV